LHCWSIILLYPVCRLENSPAAQDTTQHQPGIIMPRNHFDRIRREAGVGRVGLQSSTRFTRSRRLTIEPLEKRELLAARLFGVLTDDLSKIRELNPSTGAVVNQFDVPATNLNNGLAFDGNRLFYSVADGQGRVWELNPDMGAIVDTDTLPNGSGYFDGLAMLNGKVYIQDRDTNQIFVFDPDADNVVATLDVSADLGGGLTGASNPDELFAQVGDQIHRIDPATGSVLGSFSHLAPAGALEGIAVVDSELYFGGPGNPAIGRFSRSGSLLGTIGLGSGVAGLGSDAPFSPAASEPRLFAVSTTDGEHIYELNPATGAITNQLPAPELLGAPGTPMPIGLAFAGGNLFLLSGTSSQTLWELDPDTGAVVDSDPISTAPDFDGLALIGNTAYFLNHTLSQIVSFDTLSDTFTQTFTIDPLVIGGLAAAANPPALIVTVGATSLAEINPESGQITNTFQQSGSPLELFGVAVIGEEVYVGAGTTNVIQRYRRTGEFLGAIMPPFAVSALGGDGVALADAPRVTAAPTLEDTLSGPITITPSPTGDPNVMHFRISRIEGGQLFKSDGTTPVLDGSFITLAEGQAGLRFLPLPQSNTAGRFVAEASLDGQIVLSEGGAGNGIVPIIPVGDTPRVTNSVTDEDTLTSPIVIQPHIADGPEVTHFRITGISGGTLFQSDGVTPIVNGAFITASEASAGVKFRPADDSVADGQFEVESSQDGLNVAAQSGKAISVISVRPVNDAPEFSVNEGSWLINLDTGAAVMAAYVTDTSAGPVNESDQDLQFEVVIDDTEGNLTFSRPPAIDVSTGNLTYTPTPGTSGTALLAIRVIDAGPTGGSNENASAARMLAINVAAELPTVVLSNGNVLVNQLGAVAGSLTVNGPVSGPYVWTVSDARFEVLNGQLKLKNDQALEPSPEGIISLQLTFAGDTDVSYVKTLDFSVLSNAYPWHNAALPENVDGNTVRDINDAIFIIRLLRRGAGGPLPLPRPTAANGGHFGDVIADNKLDIYDAIAVIRYLRRNPNGSGEGEAVHSSPASAVWDLALIDLSNEPGQNKRFVTGS
jgi:outer membrane protein assembly factor BamB